MARRTRRPPRPAPAPAATSTTAPGAPLTPSAPSPAAPRRFWQDHELAWTKLVVVRLVFFGLMAVDAFRQLGHAARYGAGGFNVPQLPWPPLPGPTRAGMIAVYGALALGFAVVAQGVAVRALLPLVTALYAYAYLVSQLDSYQHHYLMTLVLVCWCFVPTAPTSPAGEPRTVTSWAVRLILVQLGVLYLWAAVAKLDGAWLDGSALTRQVAPGWIRDRIAELGFAPTALGVLAIELVLAVTIWLPRLWWLALPLGVGLHVGIELVDLEIGLFSYLMLASYLWLVPDGAYQALDRATGPTVRLLRAGTWVWLAVGVVAAVVASLGYAAIGLPLRWPLIGAALVLAVVAGRALVAGDAGRAGRALTALAVAAALSTALAFTTDTVRDHYRYWAGAARRLGDDRAARAAYDGLLRVDPSSEYAHFYLGGLDAAAGELARAKAHYRAAQAAAPLRARSFVAMARLLVAEGDRAGALAQVRDALAADPADPEALELERTLTGGGGGS